jgi:hypothetical protein
MSAIRLFPSGLSMATLRGMSLSNNGTDPTNDIDISAGSRRDSTDVTDIVLPSAITKRLDAAWAVGTNQGGLDTGAIANDDYHLWAIKRLDTGVCDVLFSLSATAPTMPTNYAYKRRLGGILRVSAAIKAFIQTGNYFQWTTPTLDVDTATLSTSSVSFALSIPTGLKFLSVFNAVASNAAVVRLVVRDPDTTDVAPSNTAAPLCNLSVVTAAAFNSARMQMMTDTSGQIAARSTASSTTFRVSTIGWIDTRGSED